MAINPELQGKTYPTTEPYSVGREKIREFAHAVKAQHPAHFSVETARELGYNDLLAPPTFAIIVAQRAEALMVGDPDSGIDFSRVVHADERFTHHRPIVAGDELVATLTVDTVRAMGGGALVSSRAEIETVAGEKVATAVSSLLVRGEDQ